MALQNLDPRFKSGRRLHNFSPDHSDSGRNPMLDHAVDRSSSRQMAGGRQFLGRTETCRPSGSPSFVRFGRKGRRRNATVTVRQRSD
jgi:hypothetical protein